MTPSLSDAFVFFGATGDLACKQISPALQAMIQHGQLDMPIIGVAKSGWNPGSIEGPGSRQQQGARQIRGRCFRQIWGPPEADRFIADAGGWHNPE